MITLFKTIKRLARLFYEAYGEYKLPLLGLAVFNFVSSALEGLGVSVLIPVIGLATNNYDPNLDSITAPMQRVFGFLQLPFTLKFLVVFVAGIFVIKAALAYGVNHYGAVVTANYEKRMRDRLLGLTFTAIWPFMVKQKTGHLEQILTTDVSYSASILAYLIATITLAANLGIYGFIIFNLSPFLAVSTLMFGLLLFYFFKPFFFSSRQNSKRSSERYKEIANFISQHLTGMKTVKSMPVLSEVIAAGSENFDQIKHLNIKVARAKNVTTIFLQPIGILFIIAIFSFTYKLNIFSIGTFAVAIFAIQKIFSYIQLIQSQLHSANALSPYTVSLVNYLKNVRENQEEDHGTAPFRFAHSLSFTGVTFAYVGRGSVIKNFNLSIPKGSTLAIVGQSGAGKTTIADLLLRYYRPDQGSITLDGTPIDAVKLSAWREQVGYVSQDIFLLNDTVANNIRFYNKALTIEDITRAAQMANCYDFVMSLPQGFDTVVGERGVMLSGGQRQRIALARILVREPSILILDEATSALDNESECFIQRALERLHGQRTIIIIAHRLSTVLSADMVVVLQAGAVVEAGNPNTLLARPDSHFRKLYDMQKNKK